MSKTITRKELITEKYNALITMLNNTGYLKGNVFPSLDDIDVGDVIYFFQLSFPDSSKYTESIEELLECHDVKLKPKERKEIIGIILPFLELFRNIT
jgi:hypothetical protein